LMGTLGSSALYSTKTIRPPVFKDFITLVM